MWNYNSKEGNSLPELGIAAQIRDVVIDPFNFRFNTVLILKT